MVERSRTRSVCRRGGGEVDDLMAFFGWLVLVLAGILVLAAVSFFGGS